jgi:hypothetical protein
VRNAGRLSKLSDVPRYRVRPCIPEQLEILRVERWRFKRQFAGSEFSLPPARSLPKPRSPARFVGRTGTRESRAVSISTLLRDVSTVAGLTQRFQREVIHVDNAITAATGELGLRSCKSGHSLLPDKKMELTAGVSGCNMLL